MFIKIPFLPTNKVKYLIAGKGVESFSDELSNYGVRLLLTKENAQISGSVASHADIAVNYLGNGKFLLESSQQELYKILAIKNADCRVIQEAVAGKYPNDCWLNFIATDSHLIGCTTCISNIALEYAKKNNLKILNVNQGYTKCSVLPVSDNAFITDDESIYKCLFINGFDTLLVKKGSVTLSGYNYGFIGGCAGKISKNQIAFCGNIKRHSDYYNIKSFTDNYNVGLISLSNGELVDVGSLIPVIQEEN